MEEVLSNFKNEIELGKINLWASSVGKGGRRVSRGETSTLGTFHLPLVHI